MMKNYYDILNVKEDASAFKVFKEFKCRFLKDTDPATLLVLLTSYMVLQGHGRKYYNLALKQQKANKIINPKYLAVIEKEEMRAKKIFWQQQEAPDLIRQVLRKYPIADSAWEFLGFMVGGSLGWLSFGVFLILAAMITAVYHLNKGLWSFALLSVPVSAIGILIHNYGITKFRQEELMKITSDYSSIDRGN